METVAAFRDPGAQRMFVRPVTDEIEQLHRFREEVIAPLGE